MIVIGFLFGLIIGLIIAIAVIAAGLYSVLVHLVPPKEVEMFVREVRNALRRRNRAKKKL
jgi:sRNA-binding carbon storage regulator CsrA